MGKFLQTVVAYHGCGNCYQDGTNKIDKKIDVMQKHIIHFGKSQLMSIIKFKRQRNLKKSQKPAQIIK